jgi:hypothetical protein
MSVINEEFVGLEDGYAFVQPDPARGKGKPVKYHVADLENNGVISCSSDFDVFDIQGEEMRVEDVCIRCLKRGIGVKRSYDDKINEMIRDVELKEESVPMEKSIAVSRDLSLNIRDIVRDIVRDMDVIYKQVNKDNPILGVALKGVREKIKGLEGKRG